VLNIGRLPILALPYYVFPLEKGRHSGILPFTFGNIERGERYVRNVGYYWAASQYWDWQGALDYYDELERLNVYSRLSYSKLYSFDGSISGNWGKERAFDSRRVREYRKTRWTLKVIHNQDFSPSFRVSASGDFRSDATYYNDYSTDLQERLNRVVRSSVNFSKRFGKNVSVSGIVSHDNQLDTKSRTDHLPTLNVTLAPFRPFGSGGLDVEGKPTRHWYNELIVTYRPRLENFSSRVTISDTLGQVHYDTAVVPDTTFVVDSATMHIDTVVTDTTIITRYRDTVSFRSRKKFTRADHQVNLSFPLTLARFFVFNPSFQYAENWIFVHRTDQSDALNINPSTGYRTYRYDAGISFSTKLYGTVHPNLFGLTGFRQVLNPEISYRFTPKIDRHPVAATYAGASARSTARSQEITFSLNHVYQAKVRSGEKDRNYELVSVTHSFGYDFEEKGRKYSNLTTSIRSNLLKNIRLNADLSHSLYKHPTGNELDFWHPHLLSLSANATLSLRGRRFLFDDALAPMSQSADSLTKSGPAGPISTPTSRGWDFAATYSYSETGKFAGVFRKSSSIRMTLLFNLTPTTQVDYSQYYDFATKRTVANQVRIVKNIHCWTGIFHWVPTGSMRGWGFMLYVTALPAVKIDNSQSTLNSSYFQAMR